MLSARDPILQALALLGENQVRAFGQTSRNARDLSLIALARTGRNDLCRDDLSNAAALFYKLARKSGATCGEMQHWLRNSYSLINAYATTELVFCPQEQWPVLSASDYSGRQLKDRREAGNSIYISRRGDEVVALYLDNGYVNREDVINPMKLNALLSVEEKASIPESASGLTIFSQDSKTVKAMTSSLQELMTDKIHTLWSGINEEAFQIQQSQVGLEEKQAAGLEEKTSFTLKKFFQNEKMILNNKAFYALSLGTFVLLIAIAGERHGKKTYAIKFRDLIKNFADNEILNEKDHLFSMRLGYAILEGRLPFPGTVNHLEYDDSSYDRYMGELHKFQAILRKYFLVFKNSTTVVPVTEVQLQQARNSEMIVENIFPSPHAVMIQLNEIGKEIKQSYSGCQSVLAAVETTLKRAKKLFDNLNDDEDFSELDKLAASLKRLRLTLESPKDTKNLEFLTRNAAERKVGNWTRFTSLFFSNRIRSSVLYADSLKEIPGVLQAARRN